MIASARTLATTPTLVSGWSILSHYLLLHSLSVNSNWYFSYLGRVPQPNFSFTKKKIETDKKIGKKLFRSFNAEAGPSMFCQFEDDESFEEFYNLVT